MIVDRDGGRSPGELRGEKAVGRVETRLRRLGLAIFKEADGERHVAHRRRPHDGLAQSARASQLKIYDWEFLAGGLGSK